MALIGKKLIVSVEIAVGYDLDPSISNDEQVEAIKAGIDKLNKIHEESENAFFFKSAVTAEVLNITDDQ